MDKVQAAVIVYALIIGNGKNIRERGKREIQPALSFDQINLIRRKLKGRAFFLTRDGIRMLNNII